MDHEFAPRSKSWVEQDWGQACELCSNIKVHHLVRTWMAGTVQRINSPKGSRARNDERQTLCLIDPCCLA